MSPEILEPLKMNPDDTLPSTYLCGTCKKYLKANKLPPLSAKNGLSIESMPENLNLTELEAVLCSRNIIFAKIHRLPKSLWSGSKEMVVNVPLNSGDLRNTLDKIKTFPRQPIEGGLLPVSEQCISVKLKRKLAYKGHHLHKTINPEKVVKATEYFKAIGNPLYQDIDINSNYTPQFPSDNLEEEEEDVTNEISCDEESNCDKETNCDEETNGSDDDDRLEAVKNNQFD